MGDQQAQIYDPITNRLVTAEEANRLIAERSGGGGNGTLAVTNPMNPQQGVGFNLPPVPEQAATDIFKAMPQLAGVAAQFLPAGGFAGSIAIPAAIELVRQQLSGEDLDATKAATEGAMGGVARTAGGAFRLADRGGRSLVKRSLNLGSTPFAYNEVAEEVIPKLALSERAAMTKAGVETARRRAAATGQGGLQDLADVLAKGRYDAANAPAVSGGGITTMISRFLDNPRQLAIGKQLAEPLGVAKSSTIGETVEALLRTLFGAMSSQRGKSETRRRQP